MTSHHTPDSASHPDAGSAVADSRTISDVAVGHRLLWQPVPIGESERQVRTHDEREAEHDAVRVDGDRRRIDAALPVEVGEDEGPDREERGDHRRPLLLALQGGSRVGHRDDRADHEGRPEHERVVRERDTKEDGMHDEAFLHEILSEAHLAARTEAGARVCDSKRARERTPSEWVATRVRVASVAVVACLACVPAGNSTPSDAGATVTAASAAATARQAAGVMTTPFEDSFERPGGVLATSVPPSEAGASAPTEGGSLEPAKGDAALAADAVSAADAQGYAQYGGLGLE